LSPVARLGIALAGTTIISQFHRAAVGVVAPELAVELGMGPAALGAANTAFFGALMLAQIPVGLALDRVGPRRLVLGLTALAVLGALAQAFARDGAEFLAARFLLGLGCAASFMAAVVLAGRWHEGAGVTRALSRVFAFSQVGILAAGAPLALLSGITGWRGAFALSAAATALVGLLWWRFAADAPPGRPAMSRREGLAESLRGQIAVWATPGLARILSLHAVGYAVMATLLALWAGPYLHDAYGLSPAGRGWVLLAMGLAVPAGQLVIPAMERRFGRDGAARLGALASLVPLLALAFWPAPPLPVAVALLVLVCFASAYPLLLVAQGRALFPEAMAGRGVTTVNLAQVLGSAALPLLVGLAGGYRAGFLVLSVALVFGLAGYRYLPAGRA
jgi:predicted MFS family arabinose efflux permease